MFLSFFLSLFVCLPVCIFARDLKCQTGYECKRALSILRFLFPAPSNLREIVAEPRARCFQIQWRPFRGGTEWGCGFPREAWNMTSNDTSSRGMGSPFFFPSPKRTKQRMTSSQSEVCHSKIISVKSWCFLVRTLGWEGGRCRQTSRMGKGKEYHQPGPFATLS